MKNNSPLTFESFRAELREHGLTIGEFATRVHMTRQAVGAWGKVRGGKFRPFPPWVQLFLDKIKDEKNAV